MNSIVGPMGKVKYFGSKKKKKNLKRKRAFGKRKTCFPNAHLIRIIFQESYSWITYFH